MDFILLGIVVVYFFVGIKKGFVSMVFSILGVALSFFLAILFCQKVANIGNNLFGAGVQRFLTKSIDGVVSGKFSNTEELLDAIIPTKLGKMFGVVIKNLIGNINFDGNLTAGAILSPTLSILFFKVASFTLLFLVFSLLFKVVERFANFLVKKFNGTNKNRVFGGVVGVAKGVLFYFSIFVALTAFANFAFLPKMVNFLQSGKISATIYNKYITKIISLFY